MQFGIGQSVLRVEDHRLVRGQGSFTGDVDLPGQAWMQVVRSPHASARIRGIDVGKARSASGVLAVLTGHDYAAEEFGRSAIDFLNIEGGAFRYRQGTELFLAENSVLASERVRFAGDAVGLVVAETLDQARDAAELVDVDYEPLPSVVDATAALEPGAPAAWDEAPDNVCADVEYGDEAECSAVFAKAAHIVRIDVGAQAAVWDELRRARADGLAVLLISADLEELIGLSDSLLVMLRGSIVARLDPAEVNPRELGAYMTGAAA